MVNRSNNPNIDSQGGLAKALSFNFREHVAPIEGWLTALEGQFLYEQAKQVKDPHSIVEIGSWKGRSTICLGKGSEDGYRARIYAIDPHTGSSEHRKALGHVDTYAEFRSNIQNAGVDKYITPTRKTSDGAAKDFDRPIGLLFIDGAHEFKSVSSDYQNWAPKVINGGVIAFHDTWGWPGVNLATAIELLTSPQIKNPRLIDTITCFEKVTKNSLYDRINNVLFLFYRTLFGVRGPIRLMRESKLPQS